MHKADLQKNGGHSRLQTLSSKTELLFLYQNLIIYLAPSIEIEFYSMDCHLHLSELLFLKQQDFNSPYIIKASKATLCPQDKIYPQRERCQRSQIKK